MAGAFWLATWPGLYPKAIGVEGNNRIPSGEIIAKARIDREKNLWLQNANAIVKRVEAIPYIETASLRRTPPADATIAVTERVPFAIVQSGDTRVLVDHALRVLQEATDDQALPVLVGKANIRADPGIFIADSAVKTLRDRFDTLEAVHIQVSSLKEDKYGELIVVLRSGPEVLLGDDENLEKKIALIGPVLSQVGKAGRHIAKVDLRAPTAPVVIYR